MITIEHLAKVLQLFLIIYIYSHKEITWTSQYLKGVLGSLLSPNSETTRGCFPFMMVVIPVQSLGLLFHSCMIYDMDPWSPGMASMQSGSGPYP